MLYMVTFTINIPQMLAYIPAPWILWVILIDEEPMCLFHIYFSYVTHVHNNKYHQTHKSPMFFGELPDPTYHIVGEIS